MLLSSRVGMFGTATRTNILLSLALVEESHASELARLVGTSVSNTQKALDALERVGVVSGAVAGRERRVRLNPRFYARDELRALLDKMALQNTELVGRASELRRRPRRAGKAL